MREQLVEGGVDSRLDVRLVFVITAHHLNDGRFCFVFRDFDYCAVFTVANYDSTRSGIDVFPPSEPERVWIGGLVGGSEWLCHSSSLCSLLGVIFGACLISN